MSDEAVARFKIPIWLWVKIVLELRRRGHGVRESGAFLLGREDSYPARVTSYVCYDDVDPEAYQKGAIAFHANGCAALWAHCRQSGLQLLIDVHTHPGSDVRQSDIDERHPLMPIVGHTAMIVPNFARTSWRSLKAIGVYEYLGGFKWRTHPPSEKNRHVRLVLW